MRRVEIRWRRSLGKRQRREEDLDRELRSHLELEAESGRRRVRLSPKEHMRLESE